MPPFLKLEKVDKAAAYEIQALLDQIQAEAANAANQAREEAIRDAKDRINEIRQNTTNFSENITLKLLEIISIQNNIIIGQENIISEFKKNK